MSVQPPTDRHAEWADGGGETLGAFRLLDEVARGELASLYRARPREGEASATLLIKRLHKQHARNPEYRSALEREAELAATFRSPLFVPTLRHERTPEPYSVWEYVEGTDLAALLALARRYDAESVRFALPLLVDALHALDYLHRGLGANSLVHQAPAARHILAGVDGRARLIDFTLAMGPATPRAPLCDHRLQPHEMAPEQVLAPTMVDARADIFILGVTLWETLTGQRLFDGKNPLESQRRMLSGAIGAPSEVSRGVHRAFDRICRRALARPRGERYATAHEMAAELRDEAMRVGQWAEPAEVGAWVRSTMALGRTAPRVVPREHAQSETAQTMMGIGGPSPAVLSIADSYRQSQPGSRNTRRLRATQVPVRRDSTVPVGDSSEPTLVTRGKSQAPRETRSEPFERDPMPEYAAPDLSQLGTMDYEDSGYVVRRKGGPSFGMIVLALVGVGLAGLGAYVVRTRQGGALKPQTFSAAPAHEDTSAPAAAPPAAWPPPVAPVVDAQPTAQLQVGPIETPAMPREAEPVPAKVETAKEAVPRAPQPDVASAQAPKAEPTPKTKLAKPEPPKDEPAKAEPAQPEPAKPAEEPARASSDGKRRPKAESAPRWDVSSTLGGADNAGWAPQANPSWSSPAAKPREPSAPPSDLPINPY